MLQPEVLEAMHLATLAADFQQHQYRTFGCVYNPDDIRESCWLLLWVLLLPCLACPRSACCRAWPAWRPALPPRLPCPAAPRQLIAHHFSFLSVCVCFLYIQAEADEELGMLDGMAVQLYRYVPDEPQVLHRTALLPRLARPQQAVARTAATCRSL